MDERGNIHMLARLADEADMEARRELEARVGKLVPIPAAELDVVKAMTTADRIAWYTRHLTPEAKRARKAERKRQRDARKAQRSRR
jgi:hypothetical protein